MEITNILLVILTALAIVAFWRGTWNLMDRYLFPKNFLLSQVVSIAFALIILSIFASIGFLV